MVKQYVLVIHYSTPFMSSTQCTLHGFSKLFKSAQKTFDLSDNGKGYFTALITHDEYGYGYGYYILTGIYHSKSCIRRHANSHKCIA